MHNQSFRMVSVMCGYILYALISLVMLVSGVVLEQLLLLKWSSGQMLCQDRCVQGWEGENQRIPTRINWTTPLIKLNRTMNLSATGYFPVLEEDNSAQKET